ncbi:MAG: MarR family transcriptional regulator [Oscillospiraceae bacterium]|jgi:DNA-binding MarR family transcriptional regulator|nr:MarR family transcriptional regulator [Oscillospiraceae bacterium]
MDYQELAVEFHKNMIRLRHGDSHKHMEEGMRGEGFVLGFLSDQPDGCTPGAIGNAMQVSSARISVALEKLEKKGLITRLMDPEDRRKVTVNLTEEGRRITQHFKTEMNENTARMLEALGEEDALHLVRIIGKMADLHKKEDCAFRPPFPPPPMHGPPHEHAHGHGNPHRPPFRRPGEQKKGNADE